MNTNRFNLRSILTLFFLTSLGVVAQERVAIDLKTHFAEKLDLAAVKNGTLLLLAESDWGSVTEFGEDYALWLGNIHRERRGDSVAVTLDVELRTGSLFSAGDLLDSRRIVVMYDTLDDWRRFADERTVRLVRAGEGGVGIAEAIGETVHPVAARVIEQLVSGLEELMPEDYGQMKLEAMAVGVRVVDAAHAMISTIAAGPQGRVQPDTQP